MEYVHITEVCPRDGLQNQPILLDTEAKLRLINMLVDAGIGSIEVTSFVSQKLIPQMADADILVSRLAPKFPGVRLSALVPNLRGLERGMIAGVDEIAVVLAASETMNQRNINMSLEEAIETSTRTLEHAHAHGLITRAYLAVAYECPFEGPVHEGTVLKLAKKMFLAGANEIVIADTNGAASPKLVKALLSLLSKEIPLDTLSVHFHDTRGMGLANAWAALEVGIRRLDSSVGGIGGCPFAPGAAGNLATEDLVLMAERCGFETGINLERLLDAIEFAELELQKHLGGRSYAWLQRTRSRGAASSTC